MKMDIESIDGAGCISIERELHISGKVVQQLLKIPKAPMERLKK